MGATSKHVGDASAYVGVGAVDRFGACRARAHGAISLLYLELMVRASRKERAWRATKDLHAANNFRISAKV